MVNCFNLGAIIGKLKFGINCLPYARFFVDDYKRRREEVETFLLLLYLTTSF